MSKYISRYTLIIPAAQVSAANAWCVQNFPAGEPERLTFRVPLMTGSVLTHYGTTTAATNQMSLLILANNIAGMETYDESIPTNSFDEVLAKKNLTHLASPRLVVPEAQSQPAAGFPSISELFKSLRGRRD